MNIQITIYYHKKCPFAHRPLNICPLSLVITPSPCLTPYLHCPQKLLPSWSTYLPKPCFLSFQQSPSYEEPSFHLNKPFPWNLPYWKKPEYLPSGMVKLPQPSNLSCLKKPQQKWPYANLYSPLPCFYPFKNSPLYEVPSPHISQPFPLGISLSQLPMYLYFCISFTKTPLPSATLCLTCPSQNAPPWKINLPSPCAYPFANVPLQYEPSGRYSPPSPCGSSSFHSPTQTIFFSFIIWGPFSQPRFFIRDWLRILYQPSLLAVYSTQPPSLGSFCMGVYFYEFIFSLWLVVVDLALKTMWLSESGVQQAVWPMINVRNVFLKSTVNYQAQNKKRGVNQYKPLKIDQLNKKSNGPFTKIKTKYHKFQSRKMIIFNLFISQMEFFGFNQQMLSNDDWLQIGRKMLASPYVRLKNIEYLAEAEHQGERFARMGNLTGAVLFVAFLKFPLIRQQPGFRRVGLSGIMAYPFYWYMHNLATKLKVKRIQFAYRKQFVQHKGHKRITI